MIVAKDRVTQTVVQGNRVEQYTPEAEVPGEGSRFECVLCGNEMIFNGMVRSPFDFFTHRHRAVDCNESDATREPHRAAVELSIKELHELLEEPDIDIEQTISTETGTVTCDIVSTGSVSACVEVFSECSYFGLRRRLKRLFDAGVENVLVVMVEGGRYSPSRVEHHLNKVVSGPMRVGRVSCEDLTVTLGTRLTPYNVDMSVFADTGVVPRYVR
jgi:hypothetical protein